jgi:predicted PurR-regulated permease PerM
MNQPDVMALLFVVMSLFILMAAFFYKIMRQAEQINSSLKDIAQSQRILANNPKDFEETKKANAMRHQSPLEK